MWSSSRQRVRHKNEEGMEVNGGEPDIDRKWNVEGVVWLMSLTEKDTHSLTLIYYHLPVTHIAVRLFSSQSFA